MPRSAKIEEAARRLLKPDAPLYEPIQILGADFTPALSGPDLHLVLAYQGQRHAFDVELKTRTAPSIVKEAVASLQFRNGGAGVWPMLLVPYLSPSVVRMLEEAEISGIDLNGNYLIQAPGLLAIRLDRKNQYTEPGDIKKVFAGNSSIVGRFLLLENKPFRQVNEIHEEIKQRGGGISLSTVSKVLTALEENLIIEKGKEVIRVLQADKLLDRLVGGYRPPGVSQEMMLKLPESRSEKESLLDQNLGRFAWLWDGATSADHYTVTTPARMHTAYTRAEPRALEALQAFEEERFYNCVVRRTKSAFVYFDSREPWASPVECYLALMQLDKREREIAQPLKEEILRPFF